MTKEEQAECTVRPYLKVYNEWNIDQTNLEEVNKEKYDAILKRFKSEPIKDEVGMYKNEAFDNLLKEQSWVCPIEYEKFNESAFYSPKRDQIVVLPKSSSISAIPQRMFSRTEWSFTAPPFMRWLTPQVTSHALVVMAS